MRITLRTVQISVLSGGFVGFQPDLFSGGAEDEVSQAGAPPFASLYPFGFRARPRDPSVNSAGLKLACSALVGEDGDEGFLLPTEDPRYMPFVRDEGFGGSTLFGVRDDGTTVQVSQLRIVGDDVSGATAGSFKLEVPYADGAKTHVIEVDLGAGKIRLAHGDGPAIEISSTGVTVTGASNALGGPGGAPVMVENGAVAAAWAQIAALFAGLGLSFTPPSNYTATKVTAS